MLLPSSKIPDPSVPPLPDFVVNFFETAMKLFEEFERGMREHKYQSGVDYVAVITLVPYVSNGKIYNMNNIYTVRLPGDRVGAFLNGTEDGQELMSKLAKAVGIVDGLIGLHQSDWLATEYTRSIYKEEHTVVRAMVCSFNIDSVLRQIMGL